MHCMMFQGMRFGDHMDPLMSDFNAFVNSYSLPEIVDDETFVASVHDMSTTDTAAYTLFVDNLTEKFLMHFSLSTVQKQTVQRCIRDQSMNIKDLFNMLGGVETAPLPEVTEHAATGLSGAYPAVKGRGRSPSVKSLTVEADVARPRASSAPGRGWTLGWNPRAPDPAPAPAPSLTAGINAWAKGYSDNMAGLTPATKKPEQPAHPESLTDPVYAGQQTSTSLARLTMLEREVGKQHGSLERNSTPLGSVEVPVPELGLNEGRHPVPAGPPMAKEPPLIEPSKPRMEERSQPFNVRDDIAEQTKLIRNRLDALENNQKSFDTFSDKIADQMETLLTSMQDMMDTNQQNVLQLETNFAMFNSKITQLEKNRPHDPAQPPRQPDPWG